MIFNPMQRQANKPKHKCKIVKKRSKSGTVSTEIQGDCSKEEIAVLRETNRGEFDD